ncbi:GNAT family N-acetyltransferase [uncultured Cohaesibacter sp.]|uniref:GNAT family N-acetyltransferase n=1 Tax=uncultured Cohaesibacter sp. TaxID=1002546 RepID=UPI0029C70ED0|nr:GNAT family N-acetyltransferase [uncultured Cohaesibacter sp.]
MNDVKIHREDTDTKARYAALVDGVEGEGELTLSKVTKNLVIADHTYVPDSMRGLGVAAALVERLISDARQAGQRIVPLCPYVRSQAEKKRSEWSDIIQW